MSNKINYYRQCILIKKIPTGEVKTTSFIPEKFAKVGFTISLKNDKIKSGWDDGWLVVSAGEKVEGKFVENQAHNSENIWTATSGPYPRGNK